MSSLQYTIHVSKDGAEVETRWDISIEDVGSLEFIDTFALTVNGAPVETTCSGGNKACSSAAFLSLDDPTKDCPVTFVITTNETVVADDGTLQGERQQDDLEFDG